MTLIIGFLIAHIGTLLMGLVAFIGVAYGGVKHVQAKVAKADLATAQQDAKATVATEQAAESQANATAALKGADAAQVAKQANQDVAGMTHAAVDQALQDAGLMRGE
jgi:hypothetical protein